MDNKAQPEFIQRLQALDAQLSQKLALKGESPALDRVFQLISHSGDSWYWLVGLVLLWLLGRGITRELAVFWAISMVMLAFVVLGFKFLIRRPRPEGEWGQIYRVTDPHSFPSGHAARAMALAVMANLIANPYLVLVMLVWAFLVGLSRVALQLHYFSDVLVGWLIGLAAGLGFLSLWPSLSPTLLRVFPFLF